MAKVKASGNSKADIFNALGFSSYPLDIQLGFIYTDFGNKKLPGLKIKVSKDEFKNKQFSNLTDALSYIRKLYREHHGRQ